MDAMVKRLSISRIDLTDAHVERKEDFVASEMPLHIFLGAIHYISILCSPSLLKELVTGHLLCEDLVDVVDEIVDINFDSENRCFVTLRKTDVEKRVVSKPFSRLIVTACGSVGHKSLAELLDTIALEPLPSWPVKAKMVSGCVKQLNVLADTFRKTGGVHVAALFKSDGELVGLAEDVGRHNAVDKVVGSAALRGIDLSVCFLTLSGRLTGDIILKVARVGIPIVASLAAAIDSGILVAEKCGVTLVGFVRGNKLNVYTNSSRIKV
jgi:FdhD protein